MSGFRNEIVFADNVDFTGAAIPTAQVTTNAQLLIGSTAAPNIKVGELTSTGGTIAITYSSPNINLEATSLAGPSLSPYIVGPTKSDFTTISAAITQAVADGASSTNQKNIYIKPNNGVAYAGGFTLPDGINLIGFDWSSSLRTTNSPSVTINGTITVVSGNVKISNVNLTQANAPAIIFEAGICSLSGVYFNISGTAVGISMTTAGTKDLNIIDTVAFGADSMFAFDGSAATINISTHNLNNHLAGTSTFLGPNGNINWDANSDLHEGNFSIDSLVFTGQHFNTSYSTALTYAFIFGSNSSGIVRYAYCQFNGAPAVSVANVNHIAGFQYCYGTTINQNLYVANQQVEGSINNAGQIFYVSRTGFRGSEYIQNQGFVQTTDATTTTIASVIVNELESITLKGIIIASTTDHVNSVGGDYLICARRATAGNITIVGAAVVNVESSSAATFTVDVDIPTQSVRIIVTGVALTTYNWTCTYNYQKILNNT